MRSSVLLFFLFIACQDEGGVLPKGFNPEYTRNFEINVANKLAQYKAFMGLNSDPIPFGDSNQIVTIKIASVPDDCNETLDVVFPDASKDPNNQANYNFKPVEEQLKALWANGTSISYKMIYDIGKGSCKMQNGVPIGTPIKDTGLWVQVSINLLKYLVSKGIPPKYIEVFSDPFGVQGYKIEQLQNIFSLYEAFREALVKAFPETPENKRPFKIIAPSIPISSIQDIKDNSSQILKFISEFKKAPPNGLSIMTSGARPEDNAEIINEIRNILVLENLDQVFIADVGTKISDAGWAKVINLLPTPQIRSAFLGAFFTVFGILVYDRVEFILIDRFGGQKQTQNSIRGEDLFFDESGHGLPAFLALFPFYLMEYEKVFLLSVNCIEGSGQSDKNGTAVMAGLGDSSLHVIVASANPDKIGSDINYNIKFVGIPEVFKSMKISRAEVDKNAVDFAYTQITTIPIIDGTAVYTANINVPSIHYIRGDLEK